MPYKLTIYTPETFGQNTDLSEKSSDKISDKSDSAERWHIDVWADRYYPLIDQLFIVLKGRGIPKWKVIIDALEFYRAFQSGDPVRALEKRGDLLALLAPLSEKSSDKPPSFSLSESNPDQEIDLEKEKRISELSEALAKATKKNLLLNNHKGQIRPYAEAYEAAGIPPAHVAITAEQIAPKDWRYKPGRPITLKVMDDLIGEAATWQPEPEPEPKAEAAHDPSRYTAHERPTPELVEEVEPAPQPRPALTPEATPFRHAYDMWIAELGQLNTGLNSSTYNTWVKCATLIDITWPSGGTLTYTCEVPHHYAKEWLDKHLRFNWEKSLSDLNLPRPGGKWDGKTSAPTVHIKILVLGRES